MKRTVCLIAGVLILWLAGAPGEAVSVPKKAVWLENKGIAVSVDGRSSVSIFMKDAKGHKTLLAEPLGAAGKSAIVQMKEKTVDDFVREAVKEEAIASGPLGAGKRLIVEAHSPTFPLKRILVLEAFDKYPDAILAHTRYLCELGGVSSVKIAEHMLQVTPLSPAKKGPALWSWQGGASKRGEDNLLPVVSGESRSNDTTLVGGIPYIDLWSRGGGLGLGLVSKEAVSVALPVTGNPKGALVAVEWPGYRVPPTTNTEVGAVLLVAHQGDFFAGARTYARVMADMGVALASPVPADATLTSWELAGNGSTVSPAEVAKRASDFKALGIGTVVIGRGWETGGLAGDLTPDPAVFPGGDADMKMLTDALHAAGLKVKLAWRPLAAAKSSQLFKAHPEWMMRYKSKEPIPAQDATGGDAHDVYSLCPAFPEVVEFHREFVKKVFGTWGFDGMRLDEVYPVGPCFSMVHPHPSMQPVEDYPKLFKMMADTAREARPDAMVEIAANGVMPSPALMPYANQGCAAEPTSAAQARARVKALKAFYGPAAPVLSGPAEGIADKPGAVPDLASLLGTGAVLQTAAGDLGAGLKVYAWWFKKARELGLASGEMLGELYGYGVDAPEAHAIKKGGTIYYAFYAEAPNRRYTGKVELRGLAAGQYRVEDYTRLKTLCTIKGPKVGLKVNFVGRLLIRAVPVK